MKKVTSYYFSSPELSIHKITSPPAHGMLVNSYIFETKNKLILFDLPLLESYAAFIQNFVERLNKPVDRIYISHAHPDHFFGLTRFSEYNSYASKQCIDVISQLGSQYLDFKRSQMPEPADLPDVVTTPDNAVNDHTYSADGIDFEIKVAERVEYAEGLYIEIPAHDIIIAGDLVYNKVHHFIGERDENNEPCLPHWISFLKSLSPNDYDIIFPGHGEVSDSDLIQQSIDYLESLLPQLKEDATDESYRAFLAKEYPDYLGNEIIDVSSYFLFTLPQQKQF